MYKFMFISSSKLKLCINSYLRRIIHKRIPLFELRFLVLRVCTLYGNQLML